MSFGLSQLSLLVPKLEYPEIKEKVSSIQTKGNFPYALINLSVFIFKDKKKLYNSKGTFLSVFTLNSNPLALL